MAMAPSERVCDAAIGLPARPRTVQRIDRSGGVTRRATELSLYLSLSPSVVVPQPRVPTSQTRGERESAKP